MSERGSPALLHRKRKGQQCARELELRHKGRRYVYARWRCGNTCKKGSDYCWLHQP